MNDTDNPSSLEVVTDIRNKELQFSLKRNIVLICYHNVALTFFKG